MMPGRTEACAPLSGSARPRRATATLGAMARLLVLALLLAGCGQADRSGAFAIASGLQLRPIAEGARKPLPSFREEALMGGEEITQGFLRGSVSVVNFWGSWCGPCRKEQPLLEEMWKQYGPRGVKFLGINVRRDQRAAAKAFVDEFSVTYPSAYDPDSTVAYAFGLRVMPGTYVIDREGRIAAQAIGAVTDEAGFRRLLDAELS